jgi:hypothetical protein
MILAKAAEFDNFAGPTKDELCHRLGICREIEGCICIIQAASLPGGKRTRALVERNPDDRLLSISDKGNDFA